MRLDVRWDDDVERVMGIEPTLFAWEAKVLPLNYTRLSFHCRTSVKRSLRK